MPLCPQCQVELTPQPSSTGLVFQCPSCSGISISGSVLRKRGIAGVFLQKMFGANGVDNFTCPHCEHSLRTIDLQGDSFTFCPRCGFIWTNATQIERMPRGEPHPNAIRKEKWQKYEAEAEAELGLSSTKDNDIPVWRRVLSAIFPMVIGVPPATHPVFFTWVFAVICIIDMFAGGKLFASIPYSIGTFYTTGIFGAYFLIVIGSRLEERVSRTSFLLMTLTPILFAIIVNAALGTPSVTVDAMSISILTCFAVTFPRAKFGYFMVSPFRRAFGFVTIPVIIWLLLFLFIIWMMFLVGHVASAAAIFVGIAVGTVAGIHTRTTLPPRETDPEVNARKWLREHQ